MRSDCGLGNAAFFLRLRRRVRLLLAERYALFGASAGALVATVMVLFSTRFDALIDYRLWAGAVLLGAVAGCAYALLRKLDDLTVAAAADDRAELKERLSTAIAIGDAGGLQEMEQALVSDAQSRGSQYHPREVFRHRFGLPHAVFGACLALLLGIIIIPQLPAFQSKARRQEVAVMKREGAKMVRVAKDIKRAADPKREELKKLANRLETLGRKMQTGRMARRQAMLRTQRMTKEIRKLQDELAKQNTPAKSLQQAQADLRKAAEDMTAKMAAKLAAKEGISLEEAMKKLPTDSRLAELARKEGPLTKSEQQEMEQALSKYADPSSGLPVPSELGEALAKLAQNADYRKAAEIMRKLASKLGSGKMSKADREALKQQMEQLAKALKGTDLDKLAKMMRENAEKLAKMSPEELAKLAAQAQKMQQMAKALGKAGGT